MSREEAVTDTNQLIVNFRGGVGELEPDSPEMREKQEKARLTAARHATGADDLAMLLNMLGLREHPVKRQKRPKYAPSTLTRNPGTCRKCGVRMVSRKVALPGETRYGGRGLCGRHYAELRRAEEKAAEQ
jgi:hypothetical protein